ncbi:GNAT family N-acetyltransferase [Paenibacillus chitinolyticus]|uniref:GNAT family N-acetyltransferase n=1 Tax=Paenibacillus chitinolyticus TaxID=79263 RepID=UPI00362CBA91
MKIITTAQWDEKLWREVEPLYNEAFPDHGRKPIRIIRQMFQRKLCFLHLGIVENTAAVMAITGELPSVRALLIDYIAVRHDCRGQGTGRHFIEELKHWTRGERGLSGILIEAEAGDGPAHRSRRRFWEACGFHLTDYVHEYSWVPERYQAMYVNLSPEGKLADDGRLLFESITDFHKRSYQRT